MRRPCPNTEPLSTIVSVIWRIRPRPRPVDIEIQILQFPKRPDHKQYHITLRLSRHLPSIYADRFIALNRLEKMAENDRLEFGLNTITLYTDCWPNYIERTLAEAVCAVFDFELGELTLHEPVVKSRGEVRT